MTIFMSLINHDYYCTKTAPSLSANVWYRFSAFWLRSKCSICSYQLNIWYEVHRTSSILNWFLDGDGVSVACYGSIKCWPCIAVPQGSAHFPTKICKIKILKYKGKHLLIKCIKQMFLFIKYFIPYWNLSK